MKKYLVVSEEDGKYSIQASPFGEAIFFDSVEDAKKEITSLSLGEKELFGDIKTKYYIYDFDTDKLRCVSIDKDKPKEVDNLIIDYVDDKVKITFMNADSDEATGVMWLMTRVFTRITGQDFSMKLKSAGKDVVAYLDVSNYTDNKEVAINMVHDFFDVYNEEIAD